MRDLFTEIFESIRRNKLRTVLTGFAVAWGIFMLIVLLGTGNGLMNSFTQGSGSYASNTISVYGGRTSEPYDGLQSGRRIRLQDQDLALTTGPAFTRYVDEITPTVGTSVTVVRGKKKISGYIEGNYPSRRDVEKINLKYGRFINQKDLDENRKVVVIPQKMAENLLPEGRDIRTILGERIKLGNLMYRVVGITASDLMSSDNLMFAPFTTVKKVYNKGTEIDDFTFSFHGLETEEAHEEFEESYRAAVNLRHRASPTDRGAIWIDNHFTQNLQLNKARRVLNIALWIIGLFTLLGGIVGVSNIMLITVKERTHEFGIRKAIGASPLSITKLIMAESVTITAFFGYIGMIAGLAACELLDKTLGSRTMDVMGEQIAVLINPTVGVDVAIEATLLLIIAGSIAGLVPAMKAARVRPIEALRAE
ncbi:MAG: ABC transporter permease [Bacteroidales bacterium]|nr:ABC transporter permease [Bacteroidales bacterium]